MFNLTIPRPTSAYYVLIKLRIWISTSSLKSHIRRRATETGRRSASRESSLRMPEKSTAPVNRRKADHLSLASLSSVLRTTTGCMSTAHFGMQRSNSATPTASIWLKELAQALCDTTRSANSARPTMVRVYRACNATRTSTLGVHMSAVILSDST